MGKAVARREETGLMPVAPETPPEDLVWVTLGDLELRVNIRALEHMALDPLDKILSEGSVIALGLRGLATAAYPMLRKAIRQFLPNYPEPAMPRRADPAKYLAGYIVGLAARYLQERRWIADFHERPDGSIELTGAREARVVTVEAVDVVVEAGGTVDTAHAERAPRTA